jgi:hypothetical protein
VFDTSIISIFVYLCYNTNTILSIPHLYGGASLAGVGVGARVGLGARAGDVPSFVVLAFLGGRPRGHVLGGVQRVLGIGWAPTTMPQPRVPCHQRLGGCAGTFSSHASGAR